MRYQPHQYQQNAIQFLLERACAGLFASPGTGKTSMLLSVISILIKKGIIKNALILAPLRVCYNVWPTEVKKWDEFSGLSVGILHGPKKADVLKEVHDIYVLNYEGLQWLEKSTKYNLPFDMLVVDESSKVKSTTTMRFKTLKKLINRFKRRYILTGSPAANSLLDLFGQCYVMDSGITLGQYITQYRQMHFYQTGFGGYEWVLKPGHDLLIHQKLAPRVMRLDAKDYYELPPLVEQTIEVELPKDIQVKYLEMERKLKLDIEENKVIAANAAVAAMYCRQIANGGLYTDPTERTYERLHHEKLDVVADLVEELEGQPTLIAYEFKWELEGLKALFPKDKQPPHIGGGVSAKQTTEIIEAWNRGEIPVLLGHPQAMSHGLNLQGAGRAIIWHSLTWSLENREQYIQRIWRQGQTERVFLYNIVAKNTIDEAIMKAVALKDKGQSALLDALKTYWQNKDYTKQA